MKTGKQLIIVFAVIFSSCNSSTNPDVGIKDPFMDQCDSLMDLAKHDFNNGVRDYTIMGLLRATDFEIYYSDYMKTNYNIRIKASCVINFPIECYQSTLNTEIEKELGESIEKIREELKQDFEKQNSETINEVKTKL